MKNVEWLKVDVKEETKTKIKENIIIGCFALGIVSIISWVGLVISGIIHYDKKLSWVDR